MSEIQRGELGATGRLGEIRGLVTANYAANALFAYPTRENGIGIYATLSRDEVLTLCEQRMVDTALTDKQILEMFEKFQGYAVLVQKNEQRQPGILDYSKEKGRIIMQRVLTERQ